MRAGPRVVVAALLLAGACRGGDGSGPGPPTSGPSGPTSTSTPPSGASSTSTSMTAPATVPAGAVTLRVAGLTLPDVRSGGTGLRVVVGAASPRLTVRRRGGGGGVAACPVAGPTATANPAECVAVGPDGMVDVAAAGGVELRATGADAAVDEVGVTYLPATRATTLVTPARPAGACEVRACEATYSLLPGGPGAFVLDGRAGGGRPRLVLTATTPTGGSVSNRTLATVEGGGTLSIRATLEAGSEARLLHHEQGPGPVAPVTAEILWP